MTQAPPPAATVTDAIRAVSGQIGSLTTDSTNPYFNNRYTSLPGLLAAVRGPLSEWGVTVSSRYDVLPNGQPVVITRLIGQGGDIEESTWPLPAGADAQKMASAGTTGQRRNLMALLGLASEDDDGNAAVAPPRQQPAQMGGALLPGEQRPPAPPAPSAPAPTTNAWDF